MFKFVFLVGLYCGLVQAAPASPLSGILGLQFDKRSSLPTLTLPDATYRAYSYDSQSDVSPAIFLFLLDAAARVLDLILVSYKAGI